MISAQKEKLNSFLIKMSWDEEIMNGFNERVRND